MLDSSRPQPQSIDYKAQELDRLIWSSIPSCFDMFWGSMEIQFLKMFDRSLFLRRSDQTGGCQAPGCGRS